MQVPLVMTVIGVDRTGLVESIASAITSHGGNWLESRMCRLGGQFAGILRIHVSTENQASLTASLKALESRGLSIVVHADTPGAPIDGGKITALEIVGHDRPGIVREITRALASQGVNVEEFSSECVSAPMSGEPLFKAQAKLRLPPASTAPALRKELERIAADLMVDISLADL
jgi:glycine cleavage system regulatory protein